MISHNESEGFYSPEICLIALGQGFLHSEANIAAHDNGECVSGVPGSQTIAGHSTVHSGTREFASKIQASFCLSEGPSSLVILMRVSLFSPPKGHPRAVVLVPYYPIYSCTMCLICGLKRR